MRPAGRIVSWTAFGALLLRHAMQKTSPQPRRLLHWDEQRQSGIASIDCSFADRPAVSRTVTALLLLVRSDDAVADRPPAGAGRDRIAPRAAGSSSEAILLLSCWQFGGAGLTTPLDALLTDVSRPLHRVHPAVSPPPPIRAGRVPSEW
jgi:hypothetical protein